MGTEQGQSVDTEVRDEFNRIWKKIEADKVEAAHADDRRHGQVMAAIHKVEGEMRRMNGSVSSNNTRLTVIETLEKERNRVGRLAAGAAAGGGGGAALTYWIIQTFFSG